MNASNSAIEIRSSAITHLIILPRKLVRGYWISDFARYPTAASGTSGGVNSKFADCPKNSSGFS